MRTPNRLSIDLDLEKVLGLAGELPKLQAKAKALGVALPPGLEKVLPGISLLGALAGQVLTSEPDIGLDGDGTHDPGPLGEGCRALLRGWDSYSNDEVLISFEQVMETKAPAVPQIWRMFCALVEAASRQPDINKATEADRRAAIQMLLSSNLLEERTSKRLGDMMFFGISMLRQRPRVREGAK